MDAGLPRVEFEAHGRIASTVARNKGNSCVFKLNSPKFSLASSILYLGRLKSDRLLEAIALRVLAALGIGAVGGVAIDEAQKRRKETDKAGDVPIARSDTKTGEKCKECPPDKGAPALQSTAGWKPWTIEYQQRVAQMPPAPPGYLSEWKFNGVQFDGFDSSQCLLKEAKARYDQFFDDLGEYKFEFSQKIFDKMLVEAISQNGVAIPKPPVALRWHFMEPVSYRFMMKILREATPQIEVVYMP